MLNKDQEREKKVPHSKNQVDAAMEDSFPASDPPSWSGSTVTGDEGPKRK